MKSTEAKLDVSVVYDICQTAMSTMSDLHHSSFDEYLEKCFEVASRQGYRREQAQKEVHWLELMFCEDLGIQYPIT